MHDVLSGAPRKSYPFAVFTNRNLRLDNIRAVGFDMDHTLARYRRLEIETLAHQITLDKLVERGYPREVREFPYDLDFVIRGLTVDKELGNVLKLNRHKHVLTAFHGRRQLSKHERRRLYRQEKYDFAAPRFAVVDTLFAMPEICVFASLVDYVDSHQGLNIPPQKLFDDTRECIDEAHRDGSLKSRIRQDIARYVEPDPLLAHTLHRFRRAGKKLFVLTNSHWPYTDAVMRFLLDQARPDYGSWMDYFDAVITAAAKPGFFTEQSPLLPCHEAQLPERDIFQGGHLAALEDKIGHHGEEVLYVGDHIYGDILRTKKAGLWRTALVVEELEEEIETALRHRSLLSQHIGLCEERSRLDHLIRWYRQRQSPDDAEPPLDGTTNTNEIAQKLGALQAEMHDIHQEILNLESEIDGAFNPYWGRVFKGGQENTRFADQVEDYACVYTSRVSNFYGYEAHQYFRSPQDLLPHEHAFYP